MSLFTRHKTDKSINQSYPVPKVEKINENFIENSPDQL